MQQQQVTEIEKHEIEHIGKVEATDNVLQVTYAGDGLLKSRFDELSIPRTLWVFRRVVFFTLCVYTGYMCEGFEVSCLISKEIGFR